MLVSAVSVLVVAQSSSEIPEGLMNNPVFTVATLVVLHSGGFEFRSHTSFTIRVYLVRLNLCRRIQR